MKTLQINDESLVAIAGWRGSGKTHLCKTIVQKLNPPQLVIVDPMQEYASFTQCTSVSNAEGLVSCFQQNPVNVRLVSGDSELVNDCLELVYELSNICLILDEQDSTMGSSRWEVCPQFRHMCNLGRHFKQSIFSLSHRIIDVPRAMTSQALVFSAECKEPADIKWFRSRTGQHIPPMGAFDFLAMPLQGGCIVVNAERDFK